jgi:hypothetical protein
VNRVSRISHQRQRVGLWYIVRFTNDKPRKALTQNNCRMPKKTVQQGRSEAHGAMKKERHVCARRRDGEPAVSCENAAGRLFQHPAKRRDTWQQERTFSSK